MTLQVAGLISGYFGIAFVKCTKINFLEVLLELACYPNQKSIPLFWERSPWRK